MTRCIYCNAAEDLSDSDIIPDGLTNAKITNKNVCRIAHNNKFSDQFESYVINSLSALRDSLDIKTKGNKYPLTNFKVTIGDFSTTIKGTKYSSGIGNRVLSDNEKNIKIGPRNIIENIAKKYNNAVQTELDINTMEIETRFNVDLGVFFSEEAKKLMAKIGYEWYCKHNKINKFHNEFVNITKYICGENMIDDVVTYIKDPNIYSSIDKNCLSGSHTLFTYIDSSNAVNIVISFFGICIYNIKLLNKISNKFKYNYLYQEFQVNSNKLTVHKQDIGQLQKIIGDNVINQVLFQTPIDTKNFINASRYVELNTLMAQDIHLYPDSDAELVKLVLLRYERLFNEEVIHIRKLKRFAKEKLQDGQKNINLNLNGGDSSKISMYYLLYLIGKQEEEQLDINLINRLIQKKFNLMNNELIIDKKRNEQMFKEMIESDEYRELIKKGAHKIRNASFDNA